MLTSRENSGCSSGKGSTVTATAVSGAVEACRRRVGTSNSFRYPPTSPGVIVMVDRPSSRMSHISTTTTTTTTIQQVQRRRSMDFDQQQQQQYNRAPHRVGSNVKTNSKRSSTLSNGSQQQQHAQTNLVHEILLQQDLSRAGVLFTLEPHLILDDFGMTIEILKSMIDTSAYANNLNQQSIVEIVLTKCISALR